MNEYYVIYKQTLIDKISTFFCNSTSLLSGNFLGMIQQQIPQQGIAHQSTTLLSSQPHDQQNLNAGYAATGGMGGNPNQQQGFNQQNQQHQQMNALAPGKEMGHVFY